LSHTILKAVSSPCSSPEEEGRFLPPQAREKQRQSKTGKLVDNPQWNKQMLKTPLFMSLRRKDIVKEII